MVVPSVCPRAVSDRTSLKACSAVESCSQIYFLNCCQNFKEIFFKVINPGIKMQQRMRKAFTYTFSQVLTVFWPGPTFHKSSLLPGAARTGLCKWERRGVGRRCVLFSVHSACLLFAAGLWGCCSENRVHLRTRESHLHGDFADKPFFWDEHMFNERKHWLLTDGISSTPVTS